MNYRLRYWDELFKGLIDWHLVNGNDFSGFISYYTEKAYFQLERLDRTSESKIPFLLYTFVSEKGLRVVYAVNNKPSGSGITTVLVSVSDANGVVQLLDGHNLLAEEIMRECYLFAVKAMDTHWYN